MYGGTQLPECILGRPIIDLGLRHASGSEYWGLADRGEKTPSTRSPEEIDDLSVQVRHRVSVNSIPSTS